jgi:hypothetical protein
MHIGMVANAGGAQLSEALICIKMWFTFSAEIGNGLVGMDFASKILHFCYF